MPLFRTLFYTTGAAATAVASAVAIERTPAAIDPNSHIGNVTSGIIALVRFNRSLIAATTVILDYRALFARHDKYDSLVYKADRSQVHKRSASRMLQLCRTQGAVYVKIGQHVASMSHAVPPEYLQKMKLLEDHAAHRPFWQIERAINQQLKGGLRDAFIEFDRVPVAAASLAQVHRARARDSGELVAVKVQYPGLQSLVKGDLTSIKMLSWLLSWVFPFFKMDWVVEQFRKNLHKELDFQLEATSAKRTAQCFHKDVRIGVPKVYPQYSTSKLLTMEYIEGFRVDDLEELKKANIDPQQVAQAVVDAFAQMIFVNGFIHCDPHAGNLMVRPKGTDGFQLFLLDHGLYRELDDEFRQSYCKLWKGLVLRRTKDVNEACEALGAPGFANVFSIFLLNRSWRLAKQLRTDIRMKMSKEEINRIKDDFREGGLNSQANISKFVERIPDELLLVFKMNSLVRNVNKALGARVNRFKVNARYAVRGMRIFNSCASGQDGGRKVFGSGATILARTHLETQVWKLCEITRRLSERIGLWLDCITVEVQFFALDTALLIVRWWLGSTEHVMGEGQSDIGLIG